ncbi:MAG: DUF1501 domain-containing protein [Halieaceae bacterium]|jgi:hypothetical protein|nr:DUF1501 domain-containing protein [Halieaceae bacterium]
MNKGLKRRDLLKLAGWSAISASLPLGFRSYAAGEGYAGPLFICLQVNGGWDVTSFCDPKMNVPGEDEINHWASSGEIQQTGNIQYAPFAGNAAFFEKYRDDMLVINGIDAQTNSHSAGVTHTWSGRLSEGYPTVTALAASAYGEGLPMGYVSGGGYQETAGLTRYTTLNNPDGLRDLILGNVTAWNPEQAYRHQEDLDRIKAYQLARLEALMEKEGLTPRQRHGLETYYQARLSRDQLTAFAENLPGQDQLQDELEIFQGQRSTLLRQVQVSLLAFQSGVSMAADLFVSGFDTHSDHDAEHEPLLQHLTEAIDYLWTYAEQLGLAERLTLFVGSDFGRTPRYNSGDGKDHWPIGSALFMQKGAAWGNRVVGKTDELHFAMNLNPDTLDVDAANGRPIHPGDVQRAMRVLAGVDQHPDTLAFPINTGTYMDFFA